MKKPLCIECKHFRRKFKQCARVEYVARDISLIDGSTIYEGLRYCGTERLQQHNVDPNWCGDDGQFFEPSAITILMKTLVKWYRGVMKDV